MKLEDDGLPPLREVIQGIGLQAQKSLGQNFLLDFNLTRRIARSAGPLDDVDIIEIGAGPGGLTRALLMEGARHVTAIERDARALPALEDIRARYPGRLTILADDALKVDYGPLIKGPSRIVANLPYNIATPLLTGWLSQEVWPPAFLSMTLMFQKEVALRIVAPPDSEHYGRLSLLCQWRCGVRRLFDVDRRAFTPPPKITSSIVHFIPRPLPEPFVAIERFEAVTAAAFGQRRKMLRSSLSGVISADALTALGIDPQRRAETLSVQEVLAIAAA